MLNSAELKQRLAALSPRERNMAIFAVVFVVGYGGYQLFWQPLLDSNAQLQQTLQAKRESYQYLQQVAAQVTALGGDAVVAEVETQSPASIIEHSSSQLQLSEAIKQVRAESERQFAVTLEKASFDTLIVWLATLADKHGGRALQVELSMHDNQSGLVDGKLVLVF
jgi:general secretion pathway protein M